MNTALLDRVADRVLRDSLRVRAGESVTIETWNTGLAFARRVGVRARRLGAIPLLIFEDEDAFVEGLRLAPPAHVGAMGGHEYALLSRTNAYVFVPGPLLGGSPRLSVHEVAASTAYNSAWYKAANEAKLRGVRMGFGHVGPELARILRKPASQIVEHQLAASLTDLGAIRRAGVRLSRVLKPQAEAVLGGDEEALRFTLGREDVLDDGVVSRQDLAAGGNMTNMPPGYYAREIIGSTLTGVVRIYAPVPRIGAVADLRLVFRRGRLTAWSSEQDQRWADRLVAATPKDRRSLTAVAIGLNPSVRTGYGQDRLVEGAVTFYGMFQGTAPRAHLELGGRPVVADGSLVDR